MGKRRRRYRRFSAVPGALSPARPGSANPGHRPVRWDEIDDVDPHYFTIFTVPAPFSEIGDRHEESRARAGLVGARPVG